MGYYFHFSHFLGEETFWINLKIQDYNPDSNFVLLDVQANLLETILFFVCPNGFGEHLFSNVYSTWDV